MLDRHTFSAYNTYKSSTGFEMNRRATKRISMFFTEQQLEKVAAHAAATGLTQSEIIRRALDQFLESARCDDASEKTRIS